MIMILRTRILRKRQERSMVKEIVHDPMFLGQKSVDATEDDKQVAVDLLDTLRANLENCVGMAANMIGVKKNIIAISVGLGQFVMINPVILKKSKPYDTEESCLSLLGGPRKCKRYEEIEVEYLDFNWKKQRQKYSGWTAQIIQHEVDHCNGVLI
jgi:peptide deformylase